VDLQPRSADALPNELNATLSRHAGHGESHHAGRAFEAYATDLFDNQLRLEASSARVTSTSPSKR
jgi:hypothetical protein